MVQEVLHLNFVELSPEAGREQDLKFISNSTAFIRELHSNGPESELAGFSAGSKLRDQEISNHRLSKVQIRIHL